MISLISLLLLLIVYTTLTNSTPLPTQNTTMACTPRFFDFQTGLNGMVLEYGNAYVQDGVLNLALDKVPGSLSGRGTVISVPEYMHYGKVTVRLKTASKVGGIVTSFITMADNKDEIDFEWVGKNKFESQLNYFYQGIPNYNNAVFQPMSTDCSETFHTYSIEKTPESINWYIDDILIRTVSRMGTHDATTGTYAFPDGPAKISVGVWDASGEPSFWTREWAGGEVDWNVHEAFQVQLAWLEVEC